MTRLSAVNYPPPMALTISILSPSFKVVSSQLDLNIKLSFISIAICFVDIFRDCRMEKMLEPDATSFESPLTKILIGVPSNIQLSFSLITSMADFSICLTRSALTPYLSDSS